MLPHQTSWRSALFLALLTAPLALHAQGQLIGRCPPPPRCPPNADCVAPMPRPCGPALERTHSDVKVTLGDRVLRYEVRETFINRGRTVAEADYVFPLPAGAAFEDLKLSINGELVSGETMNADKARSIYEEIVRRQRDPALVEWMGSGMLRTRIFPINPGEEKVVVVRFQSVATREGDALRVDYRRGSDPNGRQQMLASPTVRMQERDTRDVSRDWTTFTLAYQRNATHGDAYSPTHTLRSREEGASRIVEARGSNPEVTILVPLRRANAAAVSVLTHAPERGEPGFALFTITPPSTNARSQARDVTFVVDVSGSMSGQKLRQAREAGRTLLRSLEPEDRFRIIDFATDVREFRSDFTSATSRNVRAGLEYLDDLKASGSTNISGALTQALDVESPRNRLPLVVFITDGEPTVGERSADRIAAMAAEKRGEARVFAVGVSAGVNATLIEQLALEGRGTAHYVRDEESVERTVALLAERLATPVLTNVRLEVDGVRLSQILPSGPIDIFAGQDLVVLARYEGSGRATVNLRGMSSDGPVTWSTSTAFASRTRDNPFVGRLWATQRIGWLAAEKRRSGGNSELNDEIKTLGERFGIPTEFTSYLVLEPGEVAQQDRSRRLDAVRPTASAPAPLAAGAATNEQRFEAARAAAKQRDARSVADIDSEAEASNVRQAGNRTFALVNGVWTDSRHTAKLRTIRIKPYSAAWFSLVGQHNTLKSAFALGDRVIVAGRTVAVELAADGLEQLSDRELQQLSTEW